MAQQESHLKNEKMVKRVVNICRVDTNPKKKMSHDNLKPAPLNPVEQQKVLKERILKEIHALKLRESLVISRQSLATVTPKCTQINPFREMEKYSNMHSQKDETCLSQTRPMQVNEKHKLPLTCGMDYGWFLETVEKGTSQSQEKSNCNTKNHQAKRWNYPIPQTDVTQFAQLYYLSTNETLFSKKK
ncbi:hypothetical protein RFI_24094 [Reticulomyxa filosa]|uniref:Uncharacterized protein n=1 Tax=Reticulomyxa filosa TaxID=46433 RepID=X6MGY1_RETFI|nr:hypothetical protein RFI_24094 [Reticulomyxa filosa]|eukprot:ETO13278.1 hypothetical protein RFI_24094 [Reticulomyxa filosa]